MNSTNDTPEDSLSALDLMEMLADCISGDERAPNGMNIDWLMDQLTRNGDPR